MLACIHKYDFNLFWGDLLHNDAFPMTLVFPPKMILATTLIFLGFQSKPTRFWDFVTPGTSTWTFPASTWGSNFVLPDHIWMPRARFACVLTISHRFHWYLGAFWEVLVPAFGRILEFSECGRNPFSAHSATPASVSFNFHVEFQWTLLGVSAKCAHEPPLAVFFALYLWCACTRKNHISYLYSRSFVICPSLQLHYVAVSSIVTLL